MFEIYVNYNHIFTPPRTGAWTVTAHHPFQTDEWMRVTVDGVEHQIAATDDICDTTTENLWTNRYNRADWANLDCRKRQSDSGRYGVKRGTRHLVSLE